MFRHQIRHRIQAAAVAVVTVVAVAIVIVFIIFGSVSVIVIVVAGKQVSAFAMYSFGRPDFVSSPDFLDS